MLTASFECTFYVVFLFTMIAWVKVEEHVNQNLGTMSKGNPYYLRTGFFIVILLYTGYFG